MTDRIVLEFEGAAAASLAAALEQRRRARCAMIEEVEKSGLDPSQAHYDEFEGAAHQIADHVDEAQRRAREEVRLSPPSHDFASLERALCTAKSSIERGHAAITLAGIGGARAAAILDRGLAVNDTPSVRGAIVCARARIAREALAALNGSVGMAGLALGERLELGR